MPLQDNLEMMLRQRRVRATLSDQEGEDQLTAEGQGTEGDFSTSGVLGKSDRLNTVSAVNSKEGGR